MTPVERAELALAELVRDEPLLARVNDALKHLRPLRSVAGFDTTIIETINDACDTNCATSERAESVALAIQVIFRMCDLTK